MLLLHLIAIVVQVVISLLFVFEFRQNKNTIEFNLDECVGTEFSYVCIYVLVRKNVVFYNTFCRHTWYLRLLIFTHVMLRDIKAWTQSSLTCDIAFKHMWDGAHYKDSLSFIKKRIEKYTSFGHGQKLRSPFYNTCSYT